MSNVKCIWDAGATLGEGPVWVARDKALYWVDIKQSFLHRYSVTDGAQKSWRYPGQISSVAPHFKGGFIATFSNGVYYLDIETGSTTLIADPEKGLPGNRMNDGCCDMHGNFWFGSMDDACRENSGTFYRMDNDGQCRAVINGFAVTNGPAFTEDGKTIYYTDTNNRTVYQAGLGKEGNLSDKKIFVRFSETEGRPDGMCLDLENYVWIAHWGGSRVTRFTPDGEVERIIDIPAPNVTKCVFGGPEMKTLYITTARIDMSDQDLEIYPMAGGLFCCEVDVTGFSYPDYGYAAACG